MSTQSLMIFAKAPKAGQVKTRLIPALGAEGAARFHRALVTDVVARHHKVNRTLTVWRRGESDLWGTLNVPLAVQAEGDLGAKMQAAFMATLKPGQSVVILGTDSPTLPPRIVDAAFEALKGVPVVIGPACDGGYYLLGMRGTPPPIFDAMPWGSKKVLVETLNRLTAHQVPFRLLDFWYDIDRPEDLDLLRAVRPSLEAPLPTHTFAMLDSL